MRRAKHGNPQEYFGACAILEIGDYKAPWDRRSVGGTMAMVFTFNIESSAGG